MKKLHAEILFIFLLLALILAGCSSTPKEESTPTPVLLPPTLIPTPSPEMGAVILLAEGEELNIHIAADEESAVIESLPANAVQIPRTGREEFNGEELWVEIKASTGEAGWGNARFLTEYVPAETFCADSRIRFLLEDFQIALKNGAGEL